MKKIENFFKKVLTKGNRYDNINKSPRERANEKRKNEVTDLIVSENFKKDFEKNLKKLLTNEL
ncbi:MAG: hypothetical protein PUG48_02040, partial [Clostridia bacterium]|nr:hypothetical protein [Clostridia bacterium]